MRAALPPLARGLRAHRGASGQAGMVPLQKLAIGWLAIALAMPIPYTIVQVAYGPTVVDTNAALRLTLTGVLLTGFVAYGALLFEMRRRVRSGRMLLDERDEAILARAPGAQTAAIVIGLAAWTIGLMEGFREAGQIPVAFVHPVFWSIVLLALAALPIGILAGYWVD
jgi:hypothetical protein